jgi:hypothetical protein
VSFVAVIAVHDIYVNNFTCRHSTQSFVKRSVLYECILFTVLYVTLVYVYVQYIQDLCQFRLGTADHVPTHVAHVTTAA